jgi:hypothetical protein
MTPEQLDMIKKLQPLFKERMGEWQVGDEFYPIAFDSDYQLFVIDRGNLDILDQFGNQLPMADVLRIPKPIDWQNPKRGLWGMIDWDMWILSTGIDNANVYIRSADCYIKDDPFTALLKALCEQDGV